MKLFHTKYFKKLSFVVGILIIFVLSSSWLFKHVLNNLAYKIGQPVDSLNSVIVYYNGPVSNVVERNLAPDGYNLGLKYQCVEFVKRYYYQHYKHKMPDSYGHAKDFFDSKVKDGELNKRRNLIQYTNASKSKPKVGDLLVFDGNIYNKYGHVAIISKVSNDKIEIIQQNPGPYASSRLEFKLTYKENLYKVDYDEILGWLRIKE